MVEQPTQSEGGGSSPTSPLHFFPCKLGDVNEFVKKHHYSRTHPGGVDYAFGLNFNGVLSGACLFGHMAGNPKALCVLKENNDPKDFRELMRLVLLDAVPKNSESRFIGWCLRWLQKNTGLLAILSFADPKYGHAGTVYKASNWIYTGLQKQDRDRIFIDDVELHPRMAFNRYGTSSLVKLRAMGLNLRTAPREPKHRYVYVLRPELKPLLKYSSKDYI